MPGIAASEGGSAAFCILEVKKQRLREVKYFAWVTQLSSGEKDWTQSPLILSHSSVFAFTVDFPAQFLLAFLLLITQILVIETLPLKTWSFTAPETVPLPALLCFLLKGNCGWAKVYYINHWNWSSNFSEWVILLELFRIRSFFSDCKTSLVVRGMAFTILPSQSHDIPLACRSNFSLL